MSVTALPWELKSNSRGATLALGVAVMCSLFFHAERRMPHHTPEAFS